VLTCFRDFKISALSCFFRWSFLGVNRSLEEGSAPFEAYVNDAGPQRHNYKAMILNIDDIKRILTENPNKDLVPQEVEGAISANIGVVISPTGPLP